MSIDEEDGKADADDEEAESPLLNELKFELGITRRSRGVVQHDVYEWTHHKQEYSDNHYTLAIAAYEKWQRTNPPPVPLAVVIRIEDTGHKAKVYSEVQSILARIEAQVKARP
jgi:hypothetical protein